MMFFVLYLFAVTAAVLLGPIEISTTTSQEKKS